MNEKEVVLFFTAAALAGAAQNLQHPAGETAKRCVELALATRKEFIKHGLLPGVAPKAPPIVVVDDDAEGVQPAAPGPQRSMAAVMADLQQKAAAAGIKGIPGDGTFPSKPGGAPPAEATE